jgi:ERCC4-related helicase
MLKKGDIVSVISDNTITGTVHSLKSDRVKLQIGNSFSTYDITDLKILDALDLETLYENIAEGDFKDNIALNEVLTCEKMSGKLTNIFYSMNQGKTDYYPHQFKPVLQFLESQTRRLLIADEVGLGKTIEALYIWKELQIRNYANKLVIFCPAALKEKWQLELSNRFGIVCEDVNCNQLANYLEQIEKGRKNSFTCVCSLEALRLQYKRTQSNLMTLLENSTNENLIDLTIIDEAHYLRNHKTSTFKMAALLNDHIDSLLLLSATPIQTSQENLFNLLNLLCPEEVSDFSIFNRFINNNEIILKISKILQQDDINFDILEEQLTKAKDYQNITPSTMNKIKLFCEKRIPDISKQYSLALEINSQSYLSKYVTRSRKYEVIENRTQRVATVISFKLSEWEKNLYDDATGLIKDLYEKQKGFSFKLITRQRLIASCLPIGISKMKDTINCQELEDFSSEDLSGNKKDFKIEDLNYFKIPDLKELIKHDTKFNTLKDQLLNNFQFDGDSKLILFSCFRLTTDYLYENLLKITNIKYIIYYIHGGMGKTKNDVIREFEDCKSPSILLSTEVGSEGIDLQFCSTIINYDLPWNPMRVEQRIGRIDRLNQKSPIINIYNCICENTVEDKILNRLYTRLNLFENTIGPLDEVIGEKMESLVLNISKNKELSDEQMERQISENRFVKEVTKSNEKSLEDKGSSLLGCSPMFLSNIKNSKYLNHYIAPIDVFLFIRNFLYRNYANEYSIIKVQDAKNCYSIKISDRLRFELKDFVNLNKNLPSTRLYSDATMKYVFGQNTLAKYSKEFEVIDIDHPFVRYIASLTTNTNYPLDKCSAISINSEEILKDYIIPKGLYTYFIVKWKRKGLENVEELQYYMTSHSSDKLIDQKKAELLLNDVSTKKSNSLSDVFYDKYEENKAKECLNKLMGIEFNNFQTYRQEHKEKNENLINQRVSFINEHYDSKVKKIEELIDSLKRENKLKTIKMQEGKIIKIKEKQKTELSVVNKNVLNISSSEVAVGILYII